jgi:hypothetical protein
MEHGLIVLFWRDFDKSSIVQHDAPLKNGISEGRKGIINPFVNGQK